MRDFAGTLHIGNTGEVLLNWTVTEVPEVDWLRVSNTEGTTNPGWTWYNTIFFDAADLDAGTYTTELYIASDDPDEPLVIVPVILVVLSQPDIYSNDPDEPRASVHVYLTVERRKAPPGRP